MNTYTWIWKSSNQLYPRINPAGVIVNGCIFIPMWKYSKKKFTKYHSSSLVKLVFLKCLAMDSNTRFGLTLIFYNRNKLES